MLKTGRRASVTVTFFPHATTYDSERGISTGQANTDVSPLGKRQIQELKKAVVGETFDAIFSSDLARAIETAQGAFPGRHVIVDRRLREIDIGDFTGMPDNMTHPLTEEHVKEPFPHGESFEDVERRVKDFLQELADEHPGQKVAVIGHMGTQLALEVLLSHVAWQEAIKNDWRNSGAFQYGWQYRLR